MCPLVFPFGGMETILLIGLVLIFSAAFAVRNVYQFNEMSAVPAARKYHNNRWHFWQGLVQVVAFAAIAYAHHGLTWSGVAFGLLLGAVFWVVFEGVMNMIRHGVLARLGGGWIDSLFPNALLKLMVQCIALAGLIVAYAEMVKAGL